MLDQRLNIAIHELNTWGGQDRSTLEISKHLSHKMPIDAYVYDYQNIQLEKWGDARFFKIQPNIKRPAILRFLYYYLQTFLRLKGKYPIHATGASSILSDIVQVQYIHSTWKEKQRLLNLKENVPGSFVKRIYHLFLTWFNVNAEKYIFSKKKKYIAISECIQQELVDFFHIPKENIRVIHHGVNMNEFTPYHESDEGVKVRSEIREKLKIFDDEVAFIFVGAFNYRKGLDSLIKAFQRMSPEQQMKSHLILVGGGDETPFKEMIHPNSQDRIHFVTHQKDIRPYYWAADTFVLPSLYEPFGLVTLEAMSCGLPAIVSKTAGSAELIKHQENGLLLNSPTDSSEVSKLLCEILDSSQNRVSMAKKARQRAVDSDWSKVAEKYYDFISEVASPEQ